MSQRILVSLIMAAFPLCGGTWATLVGFEYVGKPPDADLNPRYLIRRRLYRVGGPIVIVLGLWVAIQPIVAPLHGVKWETYAPAGFHFSIELPGHPEESVINESGVYGPVENHLAIVMLRGLSTSHAIRYTPLPEKFPRMTVGQCKERLKELVAEMVVGSKAELIDDEDLFAPTGVGKEFRMKLADGLIYRGQFWFVGRMQVQLMVTGPADLIDTALARQFFDSFTYTAPPEAPADSKDKDTDDAKDTKPAEARAETNQGRGDRASQ